jgi:predicted PurR-regulated permease PerM
VLRGAPHILGGGTGRTSGWVIVALVLASLYWLQAVLIPLALAVLLTFLLSDVSTLQRWGLSRVPSVLVSALLVLSILGGISWTLTRN